MNVLLGLAADRAGTKFVPDYTRLVADTYQSYATDTIYYRGDLNILCHLFPAGSRTANPSDPIVGARLASTIPPHRLPQELTARLAKLFSKQEKGFRLTFCF